MSDVVTDPKLIAELRAKLPAGAVGGGTPAPTGSPLDRALAAEGLADHPVFAPLARGVYGQESTSGANARDSNRGAVGGMQVMPTTFMSVADRGWDIRNPDDNARAGVRYLKQGFDQSGGDPKLAAAWYYGGPGGMAKARQGVPVSDPKNPGAPNTLQYADQVAARMGGGQGAAAPFTPPPERITTSLTEAANAVTRRFLNGGGGQAAAPVAAASAPASDVVTDPALLAELHAKVKAMPAEPAADAGGGGGGMLAKGLGTAASVLGGPATTILEAASPGSLKALAGGLGESAGKVALGAQHWIGKGLQGVGADKAGQWLVDDAASGRAKLKEEMAPLEASNPLAAGVGRFSGEVLATLPVGGLLGKGVMAAAPQVAKVAPAVAQWMQKFGVALETGGVKTGAPTAATLGGKVADMGTRMAGGAGAGGAATGLADPEHVGTGAVVGALTPPALGSAIGVGRWGKKLAEEVLLPQRSAQVAQQHYAQQIADAIGQPVDQVLASIQAAQNEASVLRDRFGYKLTVPQILQNPAVSQIQRSVKAAGGQAIGDAERTQQGQYVQALDSIAPTSGVLHDVAGRTGSAIDAFAQPARAAVRRWTSEGFKNIDRDREARMYLPLEVFEGLQKQFMGPGSFGMGRDVGTAMKTAQEFGTEVLPGVAPARQAATQTAAQAVRKAGGIRGTGGEVRGLGIRESGTTGLVNNKSGNPLDLLAEEMASRGYIDDADPDKLLDALYGGLAGGKQRVPFDAPDDAMRGMFERGTMGAEGASAERIPKLIDFETMQNFRSSARAAARKADAKGDEQGALVLNGMAEAIDKKLDRISAGMLEQGEHFPPEMRARYIDAIGRKREEVARFGTGPQADLFRKNANNEPKLEGAQIPSKFFNMNKTQDRDIESFKRLAGPTDMAELTPEMKRYALTQARGTANQAGNLTSKGFGGWADDYSGAIGGLFDDSERNLIGEVRKAVDRASSAETLGMSSGSNTAQNLASMRGLGMLENNGLGQLAGSIPYAGKWMAMPLQALREKARQTKNETLAALLANPDEFAKALKAGQIKPSRELTEALEAVKPLLYRSTPLMLAD